MKCTYCNQMATFTCGCNNESFCEKDMSKHIRSSKAQHTIQNLEEELKNQNLADAINFLKSLQQLKAQITTTALSLISHVRLQTRISLEKLERVCNECYKSIEDIQAGKELKKPIYKSKLCVNIANLKSPMYEISSIFNKWEVIPVEFAGYPDIDYDLIDTNGNDCTCHSIVITNDHKFLIANKGKNIRAWNLETRVEEYELTGHSSTVIVVAISRNNDFIASGGADKQIIIWNFKTRKQYCALNGHTETIRCLAFAGNNSFIASAGIDMTIKLWDFVVNRPNRLLATLNEGTGHILSIVISRDDRFIISASEDKTVKIWNFNRRAVEFVLSDHQKQLRSVAITSDDSYIFAGGRHEEIIMWNFNTRSREAALAGHSDQIYCLQVADGDKYLVSASGDSTIRIWSIAHRCQVGLIKSIGYSLVAFNNCETILIAGYNNRVYARKPYIEE